VPQSARRGKERLQYWAGNTYNEEKENIGEQGFDKQDDSQKTLGTKGSGGQQKEKGQLPQSAGIRGVQLS